MKKLLFVLLFLLSTLPAFAQLEQGQHQLGIRGGLGFQLQNSGISYSSSQSRADWGTIGSEIGLSYFYLPTKHWGIGLDISMGDFDGENLSWSNSNKVEDSVRLFNTMLSARYTLNPTHRARIYIPVGAGLTAAKQDLYIKYGGVEYAKKKTDTSFGFFVGAGLEFDVGHSDWSWGMEMRYQTFWYNTDALTRNAPAPIQGDGNRKYEYLSFNLNLIKRF